MTSISSIPVTIVVNTRNRPSSLVALLTSLGHQSHRNWSLLIADGGEHPVERIELPGKLVAWLRLDHRVAITRDQTAGIPDTYLALGTAAQTEFVLRLEDDIILDPDCLAILLETALSDPRIVCVGPSYPNWSTPTLDRRRPGSPIENHFYIAHESHFPDIPLAVIPDDVQCSPIAEPVCMDVCALHGSHLYRRTPYLPIYREVARALGPQGHREETFATVRLFLAGHRLVYNSSARLRHLADSGGGSRDSNIQRAHGADRMALKRLDELAFQRWMRSALADPSADPLPIYTADRRTRLTRSAALTLLCAAPLPPARAAST